MNRIIKFRLWSKVTDHQAVIQQAKRENLRLPTPFEHDYLYLLDKYRLREDELIKEHSSFNMNYLSNFDCDNSTIAWTSNSYVDIGSSGKSTIDIEPGAVLMEFTGLCDKNNKDIYEGDLIKGRDHYSEYALGIVEFGPFGIMYRNVKYIKEINDLKLPADYYMSFFQEHNEVVGNVFETPELLN